MCPLAEILHHEGYELSGSDMNEGETLDRIKGYGIPVFMGHAAENIKGAELVVYSAAIKETNPERQAAKELGIPCIERSVMLGIVTRRYRRSIAVSGTHGKTTTTAMLSQVLIGSGFDPSAIIGGKLPFIGGNSYVGHSDLIVCEACEYVDTFLQLNPFISIILNIDADHLDYFKNLDNIKKSFNKFAHQTTGLLVINGDDENTLDAVKDVEIEKITYGFGENCDYRAENISADKGVQIAAVFLAVESDTDCLRHQLVFGRWVLPVFLVHGFGIAPFCAAVFLPASVVPACREIDADAHSIAEKQNEDSF